MMPLDLHRCNIIVTITGHLYCIRAVPSNSSNESTRLQIGVE